MSAPQRPLNSVRPTNNFRVHHDVGIQGMGPSPLGTGDIHDTFNVDQNGNISNLHTTVRLPGGIQKHFGR